jgi:cold shock CspA family protein
MLWFNEIKDFGFVLTEEGERLYVAGSGFAGGTRPKGRCAHALVSFEVAEAEGGRKAD